MKSIPGGRLHFCFGFSHNELDIRACAPDLSKHFSCPAVEFGYYFVCVYLCPLPAPASTTWIVRNTPNLKSENMAAENNTVIQKLWRLNTPGVFLLFKPPWTNNWSLHKYIGLKYINFRYPVQTCIWKNLYHERKCVYSETLLVCKNVQRIPSTT